MSDQVREHLPLFDYDYERIFHFVHSRRAPVHAAKQYLRYVLSRFREDFQRYRELLDEHPEISPLKVTAKAKQILPLSDNDVSIIENEAFRLVLQKRGDRVETVEDITITNIDELLVYTQLKGILDFLDYQSMLQDQVDMSDVEFEEFAIPTKEYGEILSTSAKSILEDTRIWQPFRLEEVQRIFSRASEQEKCFADGMQIWFPKATTTYFVKAFLRELKREGLLLIPLTKLCARYVLHGDHRIEYDRLPKEEAPENTRTEINYIFL